MAIPTCLTSPGRMALPSQTCGSEEVGPSAPTPHTNPFRSSKSTLHALRRPEEARAQCSHLFYRVTVSCSGSYGDSVAAFAHPCNPAPVNLTQLASWASHYWLLGVCPVHLRVLSSVPSLYPPDARGPHSAL